MIRFENDRGDYYNNREIIEEIMVHATSNTVDATIEDINWYQEKNVPLIKFIRESCYKWLTCLVVESNTHGTCYCQQKRDEWYRSRWYNVY